MSGVKSYDLAVIGSGTAAQVASFRIREAGWTIFAYPTGASDIGSML